MKLNLKAQRQWVRWEAAGLELLLSPLRVSRNIAITEQASIKPGGRGKGAFDNGRYVQLVADECLHDWRPIPMEDGSPSENLELASMPCEGEAKYLFMDMDPAQTFVFSQVRGMGTMLLKETSAAGNG